MSTVKDIFLFSGTANRELSQEIADYLGIELANVDITRFPDGETFVQYHENMRRADVFIVQPTCSPPNEKAHPVFLTAQKSEGNHYR